MRVTITNDDVTNLNKFMLLHSKAAKKQKLISTYAIPFEFIVVGLILDGLFKTVPICSISSAVLAILWLIFYPKFYKKMSAKHLKEAENIELSSVEMTFVADENIISFSKGTPKQSEKFEIKTLNRIVETENNYFLGFERGFHIVLPISDETQQILHKLSLERKIEIENLSV